MKVLAMKFHINVSLTTGCWLLLLVCCLALLPIIRSDDPNGNDEVFLTVAEIVRLRQFIAEEHYVTTTDGHILQLTRVLNPLINGGKKGLDSKSPLLLVHGFVSAGGQFADYSINARPKDYSNYDPGNMSIAELNALLASDPASNSLLFLASNFGHDVWILNRRGTLGSLGYVDDGVTIQGANLSVTTEATTAASSILSALGNNTLAEFLSQDLTGLIGQFASTFDSSFWKYSFDEQAKYDIPEVIDYVLNATGSAKLSYVGHSAGGQLILMALINQPGLTNKLSQTLLWAPALYPGNDAAPITSFDLMRTGALTLPFFMTYIGPFPPPTLAIALQAALAATCQTELAQNTVCRTIFNTIYGPGGDQQEYKPGLLNQNPSAASSHELSQLLQQYKKGKAYTYDYGDPIRNELAYGQVTPILYDVSKINSTTLSFWYGNTDTLVSPGNVQRLIGDLKVPVTQHFFNGSDMYFNHQSFFLHKNISTLVNIPALKTIES